MKTAANRLTGSKIPLIPKLILGALLVLVLSWLLFMGYFLKDRARKYPGVRPTPLIVPTPAAATGATNATEPATGASSD